MSCDLGFKPASKSGYYFLSYNSEDYEYCGTIAKMLTHHNVPIWYDLGIEYGTDWESTISEKIKSSQALLLFFTKGILKKENSYVLREYKIAKFLEKKIYVVFLEKINKDDIPIDKLSWWIDINEMQCLDTSNVLDLVKIVDLITNKIGLSSPKEKMNQLLANYNILEKLDDEESINYLHEFLHNKSIEEKAKQLNNILHESFGNVFFPTCSNTIPTDFKLIRYVAGESKEVYVQSKEDCQSYIIDGQLITVVNEFVFHRGACGDACVGHIYINKEYIYCVGGLIECFRHSLYYDNIDKIIYVVFKSDIEEKAEIVGETTSICVIENMNDNPIVSRFDFDEIF